MVKIIFNALLGLLLIFIWSRFVNIEEIFHTISKVNPLSLIPIFFFLLLSPIIRSIRLKIFLSEIKKISLKDLIMLNGAALMLNFLIPIRAGEIAKGVYLSQKYGLNLGKAVIWVFIDRFVDFLVVLLLASLFVSLLPTQLPSGFSKTALVIFILALLGTYLIPAAPGFVGSAEASGLLVFSGIFGIDPNISSSVVVLLHISTILFVLVFGIIGVLNLKLDLGLILRKALKRDK